MLHGSRIGDIARAKEELTPSRTSQFEGFIERIGAAAASQVGMVGPMSTIMMGVLILGEPFTPGIAAGTVLVIAGIFVLSRAARA